MSAWCSTCLVCACTKTGKYSVLNDEGNELAVITKEDPEPSPIMPKRLVPLSPNVRGRLKGRGIRPETDEDDEEVEDSDEVAMREMENGVSFDDAGMGGYDVVPIELAARNAAYKIWLGRERCNQMKCPFHDHTKEQEVVFLPEESKIFHSIHNDRATFDIRRDLDDSAVVAVVYVSYVKLDAFEARVNERIFPINANASAFVMFDKEDKINTAFVNTLVAKMKVALCGVDASAVVLSAPRPAAVNRARLGIHEDGLVAPSLPLRFTVKFNMSSPESGRIAVASVFGRCLKGTLGEMFQPSSDNARGVKLVDEAQLKASVDEEAAASAAVMGDRMQVPQAMCAVM